MRFVVIQVQVHAQKQANVRAGAGLDRLKTGWLAQARAAELVRAREGAQAQAQKRAYVCTGAGLDMEQLNWQAGCPAETGWLAGKSAGSRR